MTDRYELNDSLITEIEAPEKAGVYSGIAEKDGNLLPVRINLVVEHGEPASLHMSSVDRIGCNLPFDVNFKVYDAYGNVVADNTTATVEFDNTTNSVRILNGVGLITLTAPAKTGAYRIKLIVRMVCRKVVEVTDEAIIE